MWNDGGMDGEAGKGGVGSRHAARQASGETTQEAKKNHNAEQVTAKEAGEGKSEKAKGEKAKDQEGAELEASKAGEFGGKSGRQPWNGDTGRACRAMPCRAVPSYVRPCLPTSRPLLSL